MTLINIVLISVIILLIVFIILLLRMGQLNYKHQEEQQNTMKEILEKNIFELSKENSQLKDYDALFATYYNDDWNRETPFAQHIDFIYSNYVFQNRSSLETIVKNIETKYPKDKVLKDMERLFGKENTNILQNISLAHLILFSAGLKTYREDGTGDFSEASPELFLEKSINYYRYYKR